MLSELFKASAKWSGWYVTIVTLKRVTSMCFRNSENQKLWVKQLELSCKSYGLNCALSEVKDLNFWRKISFRIGETL